MSIDLSYSGYWLLVWLGAATTAALHAALARSSPRRGLGSVGLGLMSAPVWMAVWGFVDSISVLVDPDSVIEPISRARLTRIYAFGLVRDLGYLGTGFLLWTAHLGLPRRLRDLAARLRDEGFPMGRRGTEGASALAGYAWFPVLLLGSLGVNALLQGAQGLQNGDESDVWNNLTVYHTVMVSLTAAFTEELVYRVFLLVVLQRALSRLGVGPTAATVGAVAGQSVLFGLAHAGYGTWAHVLLPTLFGLVAGVAAVRFGLWCPVLLHFLVDLYALGSELFAEVPAFWNILWVGLLLNGLVTIAVALRWVARAVPQRRSPA